MTGEMQLHHVEVANAKPESQNGSVPCRSFCTARFNASSRK
jgi:hypothetical protein